jgi:hypothetical protein
LYRSKRARQACSTSWKPAIQKDIHIQAKGTDSLEQTIARQACETEEKGIDSLVLPSSTGTGSLELASNTTKPT